MPLGAALVNLFAKPTVSGGGTLTLDTANFAQGGSGGTNSSDTLSHTLGSGSDRLVLGFVMGEGFNDDFSATWDGNAMTQLGIADGSGNMATIVFGYKVGDGVSTGSYTLSFTTTDSGTFHTAAIMCSNFDSALGTINVATSVPTFTSSISCDVSGFSVGSNDVVIMAIANNNIRTFSSWGSGQTQLFFDQSLSTYHAGMSYEIGESSSMTFAITSNTNYLSGLAVHVPD